MGMFFGASPSGFLRGVGLDAVGCTFEYVTETGIVDELISLTFEHIWDERSVANARRNLQLLEKIQEGGVKVGIYEFVILAGLRTWE
jgi:hypothetical protein